MTITHQEPATKAHGPERTPTPAVRSTAGHPPAKPKRVAACLSILLAAALLAGCLTGDDPDPGGTGASPGGDAQTLGGIRGTVGSISFDVLQADVTLWEGDRTAPLAETQVGGNGTFTFTDLEPGTYALQVQHPGYISEIQGVDVEAGETHRVEFWLEPVPSDSPYQTDEEVAGLVHTVGYCVAPADECGGAFIPFIPWENARGTFENADDETDTILVEMYWNSAGELGEHLRLNVHCGEAERDTEHPCFFASEEMTSPIQIRIDKDDALENGYNMPQVWRFDVLPGWGMLGTYPLVGIDVGASYEQTFTILVTYYQRGAAPEGASHAPGS